MIEHPRATRSCSGRCSPPLLTGLIAPAIGTYIVQRRLSLLGDGLGHVAIAGVGLALLTGAAPVPMAVVVCVAGAVVVEILRQQGKATGDVGLAILFYGGLAAGVLMSGIAGAGAGGAVAVPVRLPDHRHRRPTCGWSRCWPCVVLVPTLGLAPQLFAVCTDEEFARTQGLRVRSYNVLIVVLAAVTVTLAMRTVGLLLVSALMVVPVAAAQNLVRGFYAALVCAMVVGVVVAVGGAVGSFYADTAPGALIVVLAIAVFALSWPVSVLIRGAETGRPCCRSRRRRGPASPPHVASPRATRTSTIPAAATRPSGTATTPTSSTRATAMPRTPTTTTSTDDASEQT